MAFIGFEPLFFLVRAAVQSGLAQANMHLDTITMCSLYIFSNTEYLYKDCDGYVFI